MKYPVIIILLFLLHSMASYAQKAKLVIKKGTHNFIIGCTFSNLGNIAVKIQGETINGKISVIFLTFLPVVFDFNRRKQDDVYSGRQFCAQ